MSKLVRFVKDESGATAIEYGLIAAATGLALVAVMPTIKTKLTTTFTSIRVPSTKISLWSRRWSTPRRVYPSQEVSGAAGSSGGLFFLA